MPAFQNRFFSKQTFARLASVASAVIQAIGRPDFEDGMRTGVQLEVSNGLQCVRTKPVVKLAEPLGQAKTVEVGKI